MNENMQTGERPEIDPENVLKQRMIEGQPTTVTGKPDEAIAKLRAATVNGLSESTGTQAPLPWGSGQFSEPAPRQSGGAGSRRGGGGVADFHNPGA